MIPRSPPIVALTLAAAVLAWGCGGADARSGAAPHTPAQASGFRGGSGGATKQELMVGDTDHDGIPDSDDVEAPDEPKPAGAPPAAPRSAKEAPQGGQSALEPNRDPSRIIYTARITLAVYQVDQGLATVETIARDHNGFLALRRDREITVRVPRDKFEASLAAIERIGDVLHRDVTAQDVTDELVDLEIRIKNGHAMQARLRALLEKAAVKEALEIEKELHRVTEELERLEGRKKLLNDKIAYSTITVAFEPRGSTIQATRIRLPFPWLGQLGLPSLLSLHEEKSQ